MVKSSRPRLRRRTLIGALATGSVLLVIALALFQPWKLFTDQRVAEAPPTASGTGAPDAPHPAEPRVLARGRFISHEHSTTGTVTVLGLPDGSRVLRLENLRTSNGPLLKVLITDAPVLDGPDGYGVFDDGRWVDLGDLKGNIGSSNYPLPPDVDLASLRSVSIWCDRFNVSFGAAVLYPAG